MKKRNSRIVCLLFTLLLLIPSLVSADGEPTLREKLDESGNNFTEINSAVDLREIKLNLDDPEPSPNFVGNQEFSDKSSYWIIYHGAYERDENTTLDLKLDFEVIQINPVPGKWAGIASNGRYYNGLAVLDDGRVEVSSYYRGENTTDIREQWNDNRLTKYKVTYTFYLGDPNNGGVEYPINDLVGIFDPDNANYLFDTTSHKVYFEDKKGQETWNGYQNAASEFLVIETGENKGIVRNLDTGIDNNRFGGFEDPVLAVKLNNESSFSFEVDGWQDRVNYPLLYEYMRYTVTYHDGVSDEDVFPDQANEDLLLGDDTPDFVGEPKREGYIFKYWSLTENGPEYDIPTEAPTVTGNADYYAVWEPDPNVPYTVEYYYQENGEYPSKANETDSRTGTFGTKASVTEEDLIPTKDGYIRDSGEEYITEYEGVITADGKLVLRVYFKQQFTVIYEPGDHGDFYSETNPGLDYGVDTPEGPYPKPEQGYKFVGWSPVVDPIVTKNVVYVAQWRKISPSYAPPVTGVR